MKAKLVYAVGCIMMTCPVYANYPSFKTTWTTPETDIFRFKPHNQGTLISSSEVKDISSLDENNLKELTGKNFYQMMQKNPNLSKEQIRHLWKLLTSNKVDNKVKILFYDFISFENPRYLTKEIIKQARNEKGEARHQLLVVLQSIYQKSLEENEKASLKEITDYFKELKLQNLDKNDGGIVYRGLAILAPTEFNTKEAKLTSMDKIHVDIFSLKNDRYNEIKYINNIIYHLDHPDDNLVVTASYKYLTELLVSGDLNLFSSEGKHLFREYLSNKSMIEHDQSILYTSAYIEFKAALNANKPQEIPKLSYEYMQLLPPDIQATTFNGFSDLTKKEIKKLKATGF